MIVAIDFNAGLRQIAGIGRYTRETVHALATTAPDVQLVLFYAARDLAPDAPGLAVMHELRQVRPGIRTVAIPLTERMLTIAWQRLRLPLPVERWTGPVDVVHAPDFVCPPVQHAATVLTVHDLTFRVHPETAHPRLRRYLDRAVPRALAHATQIVAVSESTARDLVELMGIARNRITVVPHGIDLGFKRVDDPALINALRKKYDLRAPFFLHVGTIEPRKNLERLMTAFGSMRLPDDREPPELILAGKRGWLADPIVAAVTATPRVRWLGPVDEHDLPGLYSLASAVVYPSLYEGFGFPALEGLACGTPVLAADRSSLPEVVDGLGLLIDPFDVGQLRVGLERLLVEPEWGERARVAGPAHARRYTWNGAAHELLAVYEAAKATHVANDGQ